MFKKKKKKEPNSDYFSEALLKVTNKCYVQAGRTGTPTLPEVSLHCFSFTHCTKQKLRHYRQASSKLSIQQKHLSTGTHNSFFFQDFMCFTFSDFRSPTVFFSQHCSVSEGVLVQQLHTATDCQWCGESSSSQRPCVCAATRGLLLGAESRNAKEKSGGGQPRGAKVSACTFLKSHLRASTIHVEAAWKSCQNNIVVNIYIFLKKKTSEKVTTDIWLRRLVSQHHDLCVKRFGLQKQTLVYTTNWQKKNQTCMWWPAQPLSQL